MMAANMQTIVLISLLLQPSATFANNFNPFSDSIPFSVKWGGPLESQPKTEAEELVTMKMVTSDNEQYECKLPADDQLDSNKNLLSSYTGPSVTEILNSFYSRISCSYRVEGYWSYELCHVKNLRQFHEEKDPNSESGITISQEYVLGKFHQHLTTPDDEEVPTIQLEGAKYPYHMVEFTDGTLCDLTQTPRRTLVYYICQESGQGDIYEIKETSTCEYSAVVLMPDLCNHPKYRANKETSRVISCYSVEGSPDRPKQQMDIDNQLLKRTTAAKNKLRSDTTITVKSATEDTTTSTSKSSTSTSKELTKEELESTRTGIGKAEDQVYLKQLLSGDHCLHGGSGWWKYEFCYGKFAQQYHVEGGKRTQTILLGKWDKQAHLDWLAKNPSKRPKSLTVRKYISQFYTSGEICDLTNKPRRVEVKLKCSSTTDSSSSHSIAIYMVEPKTCEYILTIESAMLCDVVRHANDDSLIPG